MGGKIKQSNLHPDVTLMINTLIEENALDSANFDAVLAGKDTDDLSEGATNLYYTDARADARIAAATTDDLTEGSTNLYYTDARADARIASATTDDLTEGTNLYFTDARATSNFNTNLAASDTGDLTEGTNLYWTTTRGDANFATNLSTSSTSDLSEGTNLYYTDARADARIAAATTDDLTEGSNLYWTTARGDANFATNLAASDTDDLSEGSTNLYYTDARVGTYISGNRSYGNITTTGYLAGPATFTIDPAAVGDNTGTVVIAGNLQVDGTTTTINSTTLTVDDLNITLASGAANAAATNGAGITVDVANATITYDATNDEWDFNKDINVSGNVVVSGTVDGRDISGITATNAELNVLDGITASTAELNIMDGVTATTAELNIMDGVTATTAELNKLDGVTATTTELNYVDGVTSNIQTQLNGKQATITGAATTIDTENLTASRALVSDGSGKVAVSAVTSTEIGYLDGVTSSVQTQLNGKQATITGAATTIDTENLTASRALVSDGSGKVAVSAVTSTEIGYLDGVTSSIQTQLNARLTGNQTITLSGDVTGSGTTSISVSLNANTVTSSELSGATQLIIYNSAGTAVKSLYGSGS